MVRAGLAGWPLWISVGIHVAGLATASSVGALAQPEPERILVPVEIVRVEPPLPPPAKPKPPRVVPRARPVAPAAPISQTLMPPAPAPPPARWPASTATSPGRRYMASANVPGPSLPIPGEAGRGGLLLPAPEIPGAAPGPRGGRGVARGRGEGVTSFARPLGGYQTTPHYPESARREGAEGVVTLRFEVLTSGRVGAVQVQRSTGRRDLDRAAVDAIRTWRFEPARRGKEAVAVWVTLPVRFELDVR
ncbi:MAG: energy transducer TonB [Candidatus Rokuibacteriota bacterium]